MWLEGRSIAVVGGGIGGLAAAIALSQRNARVRLFEQAPVFGEVGAGLQIAPNGVAVMEALGLRDAAERLASVPEAVELHDHREEEVRVARVPLGQDAVGRYGRPYWHMHRADLISVLAGEAAETRMAMTYGAHVVDTAPEGSGTRLWTDDGDGGFFDLVVAADGVRSTLRTSNFTVPPSRYTGYVAWRALIPADQAPAEFLEPVARVTMGPGRHVVTYPLRDRQLVNMVAIEERPQWAEESWSVSGDPAALRAAFADWDGPIGALIGAVDTCWLWGLFDHAPLPAWVSGRVALLGDACHPMVPFLAQGATMALEDAWVLADCLDLASDIDDGLATYQATRIPRATQVQKAALAAGRIYHLGPGLRTPVHGMLRLISSAAPSLLARRFDWLFGHDVTATG